MEPTKHSHIRTLWKWFKVIVIFMIIGIVGTGIFIKLNPAAAADITDNYLRPLIGDQRVISLENTFLILQIRLIN